MSADVEQIIRRFDALKRRREFWHPRWQDIADYIHPRRAEFTTRTQPGARRTGKMFDSTGIHANETLASSMGGTLTSKANKWFVLRMRDDDLNALEGVGEWLDECSRRMMAAYAGRRSKFYSEVQEFYLDMGSFATSTMLVDERPAGSDVQRFAESGSEDDIRNTFRGFVFRSYPLSDIWIDENEEGEIDVVYRVFQMTPDTAKKVWPKGDFGEGFNALLQKRPFESVAFLHAVWERKAPESGELPWASIYIFEGDKKIINEGGYHEFPYMVARWSTSSGEVYGRGPGLTALPDIKTLNKASELQLKAWNRDVFPPLAVKDDGVIGRVRLTPGAQTSVRDDASKSISPITTGARWDVSQIKSEELRQSIRKIFFADQLQLQNTQVMTATESEIRFELMQRLLGPTAGRIESEFLTPLTDRCFAIMFRAGAFPPVPDSLAEALEESDVEIDVEYEGPLARAQRSRELAAIQRYLEATEPVAVTDPSIRDHIDPDGYHEVAVEIAGVQKRLFRKKSVVEEIRAQRAQAEQEEAQKADLERTAQGAKDFAPAIQALQGGRPA